MDTEQIRLHLINEYGLTERECDVLAILAERGHYNPVIGSRLGITDGTVTRHLVHIYSKLKVPGPNKRIRAINIYIGLERL